MRRKSIDDETQPWLTLLWFEIHVKFCVFVAPISPKCLSSRKIPSLLTIIIKSSQSGDLNSAHCSTLIRTVLIWMIQKNPKRKSECSWLINLSRCPLKRFRIILGFISSLPLTALKVSTFFGIFTIFMHFHLLGKILDFQHFSSGEILGPVRNSFASI